MVAERTRWSARTGARRNAVRQRIAARLAGVLGAVLMMPGAAGVHAQPVSQSDMFAICEDQRYALCATASCLVYNDVAYCKCDVKFGDSISLPFDIESGDICSVNRQGYWNGFMMSTYSLPNSVIAGGNKALYTCLGRSSDGAYAQCDGGFCFTSTRARKFPGFDRRLKSNEIICSCPITVADPSHGGLGYQMVGPFPCQEEFYDNCSGATANTDTGSTIYVGAPTGTPRILTRMLDDSVPKLNQCPPPR